MKKIESFIREIPNFPKHGINFKDITPLLQDPDAMRETVSLLIGMIGDVKIDKVVGIESRGFLLGPFWQKDLMQDLCPLENPVNFPSKPILKFTNSNMERIPWRYTRIPYKKEKLFCCTMMYWPPVAPPELPVTLLKKWEGRSYSVIS